MSDDAAGDEITRGANCQLPIGKCSCNCNLDLGGFTSIQYLIHHNQLIPVGLSTIMRLYRGVCLQLCDSPSHHFPGLPFSFVMNDSSEPSLD